MSRRVRDWLPAAAGLVGMGATFILGYCYGVLDEYLARQERMAHGHRGD